MADRPVVSLSPATAGTIADRSDKLKMVRSFTIDPQHLCAHRGEALNQENGCELSSRDLVPQVDRRIGYADRGQLFG